MILYRIVVKIRLFLHVFFLTGLLLKLGYCVHVVCCMSLFIYLFILGWLGGAKVSCILHHQGVQLILAYSWAKPAILVAGKGRGEMFLLLLFLHFHSFPSFFIESYINCDIL